MKKITAIILAVVLVVLCAPFSFAASDDLSLIFATDVHFSAKASSTPVTTSTDENPFGHTVSNGKLTVESEAVLNEFFAQAAASDASYVIFTGDISDNGETENVEAIVERLENFEKSSGKKVIACMGNHETYHVSATNTYISGGLTGPEFREYYKNLGPDLALDVDDNSASYTVDLNSKYRIICIDANVMNQNLFDWIEAQALKAKEDGKRMISVSHFSLFPHYQLESLAGGSIIDSSYNLPDKFIEWGIKFNFSGHTHELDCAQYTNDNGVVYDTTCGALTTYPANYKTAKFTDYSVSLDTKYIEKVDTSLVPSGIAQTAFDLLSNNFREYAKTMFVEGAQKEIMYYINWSYIVSMAKLDYTRDADIINLLKVLVPKFEEAIKMPLYGKNSLAQIAAEDGYPLPESSYNTLFEAFCNAYAAHCAGNEACSVYTPLGKLLQNGVAAALTYAFEELSIDDFKMVINWALDTFELPVEIPSQIRNIVSYALSKYEVIEYIVLYVASPVLDDFLSDAGPDDVSVVLPGYDINESRVVSVWEKIKSFFAYIRMLLNAIFAFLGK